MSPIRKRGDVYWLDASIAGKRHRVSLGMSEYYLALDKARKTERRLGREAAQGPVTTFAEFKKISSLSLIAKTIYPRRPVTTDRGVT